MKRKRLQSNSWQYQNIVKRLNLCNEKQRKDSKCLPNFNWKIIQGSMNDNYDFDDDEHISVTASCLVFAPLNIRVMETRSSDTCGGDYYATHMRVDSELVESSFKLALLELHHIKKEADRGQDESDEYDYKEYRVIMSLQEMQKIVIKLSYFSCLLKPLLENIIEYGWAIPFKTQF